jgi:hypothetical protein
MTTNDTTELRALLAAATTASFDESSRIAAMQEVIEQVPALLDEVEALRDG